MRYASELQTNPKQRAMSDKLKNFIVRTLSGAVMLAVLLCATLYSVWSFWALALLIIIGGVWEFYNLAEATGHKPMRWLGLLMSVITMIVATLPVSQYLIGDTYKVLGVVGVVGGLLLLVMPSLMLVKELFFGEGEIIKGVGSTLLGVLYVALPISLLPALPLLICDEWSAWTLLWFIFIIWANDVFAYLVGITMGKHKMCPTISPKKSWEGFIGGIIGSIVAGYVASTLLEQSFVMWALIAIAASTSGVAGDLIESQLKRRAGVKDSGNIIPGHGGVLDRFDALLLATPIVVAVVFVFRLIFNFV